jgi:DNA-binding CsgD family transcriptional regulator
MRSVRQSPERVREQIRRVCREAPDFVSLQRQSADLLANVVPYDRWCAVALDPATSLTTTGYHAEGLPADVVPRLLEIEAADEDVNGLPGLVRGDTAVSTIERATLGRPEQSARYRDVLAPSGLGRELRAGLRDASTGWGAAIFFRETSAPDFDDDELRFVDSVGSDLARGIRRCLLTSELTYRDSESVAGMLVVAEGSLDVALRTRAAGQWLEVLADGSGTEDLPMSVVGLVARARGSADGVARSRMRAADGRWLTMYAEATEPRADAQVSLVIEPTRPYELASVLVEAYQLTQRERDVARHVLLGRSTAEIAETLFLSAWTVQDHLKKVFDKVGVRTRAELATRLFFGDYLPRSVAGTPLGADGWFIDDDAGQPRGKVPSRSMSKPSG